MNKCEDGTTGVYMRLEIGRATVEMITARQAMVGLPVLVG